jgi:hypothetical protein
LRSSVSTWGGKSHQPQRRRQQLLTSFNSIFFIIGWLVKLCFFKRADAWEEKQRPKMIKCFAMAMGSYAVLGFGAWVMDMLMCEFILSQWTVLQMFLRKFHPNP